MARDVRVAILGDARDFSRAVRDAQQGAGKLNRSISGVRKMALGLGGAFAAREVVEFGASLISAAEESQKVTRQTTAVIKSMGNSAKVSAGQVEDLATELSLKSGIDDELIQSGSNVLLTFRNIRNEVGKGNDIFDQANALTLDLSVALGKDLNSSAIMVGKALNDPIAGLTALTRAGVQFTEQQKEQIRQMVAVGDIAGAQKIILGELSSQFAGSAEAQATATDKLRVAWDNIKEQLGEQLLPVVERFATWLAEHLPAAMATAQAMGERLSQFYRDHEGLVRGLAVAVGTVLVGAMVAYTASAVSAAVATVAATWPILAVVAAIVLLTAGLIYAYQNWGWFRDAVNKGVGSVIIITKYIRWLNGAIQGTIGLVDKAIKGMQRLIDMAPSLPSLPGGIQGSVGVGPLSVPFGDRGGVMPGPRGVHSLAMVAGGETLLPTHKSSFKGGGGRPMTLVLEIGGRHLGSILVDELDRVQSSDGAIRVRTRAS